MEKIPAFQGLNSSLLAKYPDSPLTEILKNRLIKIIITLYIFAETSHNFLMKPAFKCFLDCKCCYFPILKALLQCSHIFSQTELSFKDLDLIFLIFTIPPYSQNEKRVIVLRSRFLWFSIAILHDNLIRFINRGNYQLITFTKTLIQLHPVNKILKKNSKNFKSYSGNLSRRF